METILTIALLVLSADYVRLRILRHRQNKKAKKALRPVNELENGLLLPAPDDERWRETQATLTYYNATPQRSEIVRSLSLGEVWVTISEEMVFVGKGPPLVSPDTKQYARAVIGFHRQRLALKSIGETDFEKTATPTN
jgi:hypothetical protein